jgi:predicted nucleotidyltransferase
MKKKQIIKKILDNKDKIKDCDVKRLGIFGSFARGKATKSSDIDVLVDFNNKTFDNYMNLKFLLQKLFKRSVDLVICGALKPGLRPLILKEVTYVKGL